MNNKIKAGEYYAICSLVEKDIFSSQRVIIVETSEKELLVDEGDLRISSDGFVAARFYIEEIKNGLARGVVYNCQDGYPSGKRIIPLDSIVIPEKVKKYDGRTQKNL